MTLDKVYLKVCALCFDSSLFYRINYVKLANKFCKKTSKYDISSFDISSIKITEIGIECNLFTMKIKQITTIENINVSHNRILTH